MKKLLLTAITMASLFSCSTQEPVQSSGTDITIVVDHTDPFALLPQANPILAMYGLSENENQKATFRLATISDKRLNPLVEYALPDEKTTEKENTADDVDYRKKQIISFYGSVRNCFSDVYTVNASNHSLQYSECYRTIAHQVQILSQSDASKKYILVFSDLQEKSDLLNCYSQKGQKLLQNNMAEVVSRFTRAVPLPKSLHGITVIFIYKPMTREEDKRYFLMEKLYQQLLESNGAKVIVQAQSDTYTP